MTAGLARFTQLLQEAESAASSFDGRRLSAASAALTECVEALLQEPLDKAQADALHAALCGYRDLCAFLQDTLHGALLRAASGGQGASYAASLAAQGASGWCPPKVGPTHVQPLLRRYA